MPDSTDIPALVERVRELDKAATPGPWDYELPIVAHGKPAYVVAGTHKKPTIVAKPLAQVLAKFPEQISPGGEFVHNRNAAATALFRTAAPVLADEVERLRGMLLKLWYGIDDDWADHEKNAAVCNEVRETLFPDKEAR